MFNMVSFWVQLHGIPLEALTRKNAEKIGGRLGFVEDVEDPFVDGQIFRSFLKVRVLFDINQAFTTGFWVLRRDKGKIWVWIKYERLARRREQC